MLIICFKSARLTRVVRARGTERLIMCHSGLRRTRSSHCTQPSFLFVSCLTGFSSEGVLTSPHQHVHHHTFSPPVRPMFYISPPLEHACYARLLLHTWPPTPHRSHLPQCILFSTRPEQALTTYVLRLSALLACCHFWIIGHSHIWLERSMQSGTARAPYSCERSAAYTPAR